MLRQKQGPPPKMTTQATLDAVTAQLDEALAQLTDMADEIERLTKENSDLKYEGHYLPPDTESWKNQKEL